MIKKRKGASGHVPVYLVEDDRVIAKTIADKLTAWYFTVKCTQDFSSILGEFVEFQPHLVLMDITLPFFNGYHWCQEIRRVSQVPILFLSSAAENINIVMAINMGQTTLLQSLLTSRCCWQKSRRPFAGHMTIKGRVICWNTTVRCSAVWNVP